MYFVKKKKYFFQFHFMFWLIFMEPEVVYKNNMDL